MKKAQVSVEFIIGIAFMLIMLVFVINQYDNDYETKLQVNKFTNEKVFLRHVAQIVNSISIAGSGANVILETGIIISEYDDLKFYYYPNFQLLELQIVDKGIERRYSFPVKVNGMNITNEITSLLSIKNIRGEIYFS